VFIICIWNVLPTNLILFCFWKLKYISLSNELQIYIYHRVYKIQHLTTKCPRYNVNMNIYFISQISLFLHFVSTLTPSYATFSTYTLTHTALHLKCNVKFIFYSTHIKIKDKSSLWKQMRNKHVYISLFFLKQPEQLSQLIYHYQVPPKMKNITAQITVSWNTILYYLVQ
jgi:hypothetical protein